MTKLTAPDAWSRQNCKGPGITAWHHSVPNEVRQMILSSEHVPTSHLVSWFKTEVSDAYPEAKWPKDATVAKVEALLRVLREEA